MKEINKILSLKSFITITLIITLEILVVIFVFINKQLDEKLFLLFSNITTMVVTYYFSKETLTNIKNHTSKEIKKDEEEIKNE